jgi:TolB-like protein/Flp pilus assembly protein TadD/tRNA A-37 threonylcarbamoyl transferase component Bud32
MLGQTISHYKILEKLGEGGMGVVYKAEDLKLRRIVALKFLPQHLTSTEAEQARFLQEAQAAATLNHPNICTIHAIEEAEVPGGGVQQFIDMEYVDGATLRRKLPFEKPADAVALAAQVGEALQEAHMKGIVHRDIKAENIMVNAKGQAKVMDFGLAKLKGSLKLTKTSSTVGTLAYMAPEQIQGGEVDARSDIFSFGILVFEMLAGKTPFRGEHEAAAMYSIMNEEPESLLKYRPELSPELDRIIKRALEKDPEDRFQSAADMVSELRREQKKSTRVVRSGAMDVAHASAAAVPAPLPAAAPSPKSRAKLVLGAALGIALIGAALAYFLFLGKPQPIDSLVVLPFENVGGGADLDYLSDGITENIINSLTKIQGLRVVPRSSAFRFKGKDLDASEIGAKLNVRAILSGKIVHRGTALDVQVDLVDVKNESQLWGNRYQSDMAGVLNLQDNITKEVSAKLGIGLTSEARDKLTKRYTENTEAYQLYLQGRFYWNKRNSKAIDQAFSYFRQAIALDSAFALAYAGLADCYILQPQYQGIPTGIAMPQAAANAQRALALDSSLAEAHTTLAFGYTGQYRYAEAEREFQRALELNPRYTTAYHWYGIMLGRSGHPDRYLALLQKAIEIDPYSPVLLLNFGVAQMALGNLADARQTFNKVVALDSSVFFGHMFLGIVDGREKKYASAVEHMLKGVALSDRSSEALGYLGYAYAKAGMRNEALALIKEDEDRYRAGTGAAYNIARIYAGLGDKEKTMELLEQDWKDQSTFLSTLLIDTSFDLVRDDPRFVAILRNMKLVP